MQPDEDGELWIGADGELTEADERAVRALGRAREGLVGRPMREVVGADAAMRLTLAMQTQAVLVFSDDGEARTVCFPKVVREGAGARVSVRRQWQSGGGASLGVAPWVFESVVHDSVHAAISKLSATLSALEIAMIRDNPEGRRAAMEMASGTLGRTKTLLDGLNEVVRTGAYGPGQSALDALLDEAAERARASHPRAKIARREAPSGVRVMGDFGALSEALEAVVANAVEADVEGRGVELWCEVDARGRLARVFVRDRGEGMSADAADNAFRPFRSTRGRAGLGLTRARYLAAISGGAVSLASEAGVGTTVTLTLACV